MKTCVFFLIKRFQTLPGIQNWNICSRLEMIKFRSKWKHLVSPPPIYLPLVSIKTKQKYLNENIEYVCEGKFKICLSYISFQYSFNRNLKQTVPKVRKKKKHLFSKH